MATNWFAVCTGHLMVNMPDGSVVSTRFLSGTLDVSYDSFSSQYSIPFTGSTDLISVHENKEIT